MMTNTDLVVVLPGIMGSTLEKDNKLVWAPSAGSVLQAVTSLGRRTPDPTVRALESRMGGETGGGSRG